MVVFIDESGDVGFKTKKGSTTSFVISMVIFDDDLEAEKTAVTIKQLRRDLKLSDNFEFKFNKTSKELRCKFLETVKKFDFRCRSIIFTKDTLYSPFLKQDKDCFYSYAVKQLLKYSNGTIKDAKIKLDGSGERIFKKQLTAYLRRELNSKTNRLFSKFDFVDSKKNVLIQLADMVAGSIRRTTEKEKGDSVCYQKILGKRIEDIWKYK